MAQGTSVMRQQILDIVNAHKNTAINNGRAFRYYADKVQSGGSNIDGLTMAWYGLRLRSRSSYAQVNRELAPLGVQLVAPQRRGARKVGTARIYSV